MKIQIGHTPDADDAYMLFGLLSGAVGAEGLEFQAVEAPYPMLNDRASRGELELTMLSTAAYGLCGNQLDMLESGSSFGLGIGPVIVSREEIPPSELTQMRVAIPGATTTAYAMLQLFHPALQTTILPFEKLLPAVETGMVDCALVIQEESVFPRIEGLHVVLDLGTWWSKTYDALPMPISCCAVKRSLEDDLKQRLAGLVQESIRYAMDHHAEALEYAGEFATRTDPVVLEQFIRRHVNELSLEMGEGGREALERFFADTASKGILPDVRPLRIVTPE